MRKEPSEIVAVVQQALESMQAVKAFGRQDMEQQELCDVSHATVDVAAEGAEQIRKTRYLNAAATDEGSHGDHNHPPADDNS